MKLSLLGKMKRWLLHEDEKEPRRAPRARLPEIVVHYWDGSAPEGRHVRDISETGAYIYTPERWYLGTIIRIVLQGYHATVRQDGSSAPTASISVPARVVRHGSDGVAVEFVFRDKEEEERFRVFLAKIPVQPDLTQAAPTAPTGSGAGTSGQALIEFSLIIPMVFLLAINAVNFGGFIFAWITVADAARAGAQYVVMSSSSPGAPTPATLDQVTTLVKNDVKSLLNGKNVLVAICYNATTAVTACGFADPEAPAYTLATVDVTYHYTPLIRLFSFPGLGIGTTLLDRDIHRKAVMRMLQ